jgi:hypothetical protein
MRNMLEDCMYSCCSTRGGSGTRGCHWFRVPGSQLQGDAASVAFDAKLDKSKYLGSLTRRRGAFLGPSLKVNDF